MGFYDDIVLQLGLAMAHVQLTPTARPTSIYTHLNACLTLTQPLKLCWSGPFLFS